MRFAPGWRPLAGSAYCQNVEAMEEHEVTYRRVIRDVHIWLEARQEDTSKAGDRKLGPDRPGHGVCMAEGEERLEHTSAIRDENGQIDQGSME
jgi:hypothetical protein